MSCSELQEEELEVLRAIYDGDENYKELSPTKMQYMIGEKGSPKSFLVELSWDDQYPNKIAIINLDAFYNKHISQEIKTLIKEKMEAEASLQIGTAMTYTLFEFAKENSDDLTMAIDLPVMEDKPSPDENIDDRESSPQASVKLKQPRLTKQQKRKLADKTDSKGDRLRGWNWVDVVKHLSQTGSSKTEES